MKSTSSLCVSQDQAQGKHVEWMSVIEPLPWVLAFLKAMSEEDTKPQKALVHGITTLVQFCEAGV